MAIGNRLRLPDAELLVLLDLAERADVSEGEYLVRLIREAAWREVAKRPRPAPPVVEAQECAS